MGDRVACEARGIREIQLVHDLMTVFLDGLDADAQDVCGLLIGIILAVIINCEKEVWLSDLGPL
jgi:hypothetical protein